MQRCSLRIFLRFFMSNYVRKCHVHLSFVLWEHPTVEESLRLWWCRRVGLLLTN